MPMTRRAAVLLITVATLGQIDKYKKSNESMNSIGRLYRNSSLVLARALRRASRTSARKALASTSRVVTFQFHAREKQLLTGENPNAPVTAAGTNHPRTLRLRVRAALQALHP